MVSPVWHLRAAVATGWARVAGLLLLLLSSPVAHSQDLADEQAPRVVAIEIVGEFDPFGRRELMELVRTRPNRRFLGVPGVTPSLWLHQLGTPRTAIGRALQRAGEPPALLEPQRVEDDRLRLQTLYRQAGFLDATVTANVELRTARHAAVEYVIARGPASQVRRFEFEGLQHLSGAERQALLAGSALRLREVEHAALAPVPALLAGPDQRLAEAELLEERRRLLAALRDVGFALVTRDSIRAFAQPLDTLGGGRPVFDVRFAIATGPRVAFGDVRFRVTGPESTPPRVDTTALGDGQVVTSIVDDTRLSPSLLRRTLRFEPGDVYDQSALVETRRRLDATGVFTFSEVSPRFEEMAPAAQDTVPRLPHSISLRTRPRHSIRLEGFVLQRTGVVGAEGSGLGGDELGVGVGATYRNVNAFGRGEHFTVGANASVAGDFVEFPTAQIEGSASIATPYLLWPFGPVERLLDPYDVRTRVSAGFLAARRDELRLLIRGRATAGFRLELHHSPTLASLVDLLDFHLSDPDTLSGFRQQFLDLIEDPVARQFVLEDYTNPQINNALRYTLRSMTADPFRRDRGHAAEAAVEVGGNLPYLLDRFVFSPGEVEGSLPGIPLFGGGGRLEYRPYLRATADARRYVPVDPFTVVAVKGMAGVAHPTGHAPVVPFDRRFYIGGVGSVRGWDLRQLGPGRVPPEASAFVQGGDIKLEAAAEVRRVFLRDFLAADWQLAVFADAGNIWFGPRNPGDPDGRFRLSTFPAEIAVGAGTGLRVAWEFLILRFDLAWQVRSPVPGEPLFPEGNNPRLHFGIGQAF